MKVKRTVYTILLDVACLYHIGRELSLPPFAMGTLSRDRAKPLRIQRYTRSLSDKSSLLVTPLMALIIFCGITVTERFPQIWNTGVKVTEENRERVYSVLHHMISTIKFLSLVILTSISVIASLAKPIPLWFLLLSLLLLFGSMVFF